MKKLFKPLNDWYDSLKEPWRLLVLMTMTVIWSGGISLNAAHRHPIIAVIAVFVLFFQTFWGLSRN